MHQHGLYLDLEKCPNEPRPQANTGDASVGEVTDP